MFLAIKLIFSQTIPVERTAAWSQAGLIDSIYYQQNFINIVTDLKADNSGQVNAQPIIQQAIDSLTAHNGGTVYLPPGTYRLEEPVQMRSFVKLKGATADSTFLELYFGNYDYNGITFSGSTISGYNSTEGWFTKGSDSLLLSDSLNINIGDYIEIIQDNGSWDNQPASWANHAVGMISKVTDKQNKKIFLNNRFSMDLDSSLNPRLRIIQPIKNAALECLHIERKTGNSNNTGHNINMSFAWNCRVVGIESHKSAGAHISVYRSAHNSFFGNYLHHSFAYDGGGTRGYGIMFTDHACYNRAENNVFKQLRHALMTKAGANTNVIGYNYSLDVYRSEIPHNASGDISLHGHYSFANLFEGNIVQNLVIDHYWGPSGPYNTFFRNRTELYGFIMTTANTGETSIQNIVGNEITMNSTFPPQYIISGTDHFEFGNNINGLNTPSNTQTLTDSSLYLKDAAPFWNNNLKWPAIGYPNNLNDYDNPAKLRYSSGKQPAICYCRKTEKAHNSISEDKNKTTRISIYPNPAKSHIYLKLPENKSTVKIFSFNGKLVREITTTKKVTNININSLPAGIYIMKTTSMTNYSKAKKFIKL